jgi:hypothetical protein
MQFKRQLEYLEMVVLDFVPLLQDQWFSTLAVVVEHLIMVDWHLLAAVMEVLTQLQQAHKMELQTQVAEVAAVA